jgi:hypothetical protein
MIKFQVFTKVPQAINCSGVELTVFFFVAFDERIRNIIGAAHRNAWSFKKCDFLKNLKNGP